MTQFSLTPHLPLCPMVHQSLLSFYVKSALADLSLLLKTLECSLSESVGKRRVKGVPEMHRVCVHYRLTCPETGWRAW